ncbi:unnamed protein product [Rotaria sordida]|uniref:Snake toxin/toxin-like domain-containing protein n=1 Tax=Rotaria sordida TaxID=392033 RepID=A0A813V367_9BILA|nr:unnamed protein product [Rotaria sordida]CAF0840870.1 unnamed protein product [Rotaria sordida]CAF1009335.1 unnamed protein product [Rotaria sordida]CAF3524905.1 unnamed protein product [Rotaria sordida]
MTAVILLKILIIAILLFIFYVKLVSTQLLCWKCDPCPEPHDNRSSLVSAVTCTSSQTICVKNTIRVLNRAAQISKGCVQSCTPSSSHSFGQGAFVDCCNTNYCNLSTRNQLSLIIYIFFILIYSFVFLSSSTIGFVS